jgi:hypothetical protein
MSISRNEQSARDKNIAPELREGRMSGPVIVFSTASLGLDGAGTPTFNEIEMQKVNHR